MADKIIGSRRKLESAIAFALALAVWSLAQVGGANIPTALADNAPPASAPFSTLIASAQSSATENQPVVALAYYTLALRQAGADDTRRRIALFGMGRMLIWLGRYHESESIYRNLLATNLSQEDRDVARAGLVKSLDYSGRPMAAYAIGASAHTTQNPELAIETARAAEAAGWPDKAETFLTDNAPALSGIEPGSRLDSALHSVRRDLASDFGPLATVAYEGINDSDGLHTDTANAQVSARTGQNVVAHISYDRIGLAQDGWSAAGVLASAGASGRIGDHVWLSGAIGRQTYPAWQTETYDASIAAQPDDRYGGQVWFSREAVQTQNALAQHLTDSLAGISADTTLVSNLTFAAAGYQQNFSDGNSRAGISAMTGAVISDAAGLSAHLRWRSFVDSIPGSAAYFDPQHYGELATLVTESRRLGPDWHVGATVGVGRQFVAPGGPSTTVSYDASIAGYLNTRTSARADFGYSNSALATISGYQRRYAGISLSYRI